MKDSKIVPGEINGFLDRSTMLTGELRFNDTFRIDGQVKGRIISDNVLIVGEAADVSADIEVAAMTVMGRVSGSVVKVHVSSSAGCPPVPSPFSSRPLPAASINDAAKDAV